MIMDYFWIAIGMIGFGYFIGDGLKNFQSPLEKRFIESAHEEDEHELIKEKDVHLFIGISKEDIQTLLKEHPDIPHIIINSKVFYPKAKLRKWLLEIGE